VSGFVILFAPFMAMRHALLAVPALLLWQGPRIAELPVARLALALLLTSVAGIWLALSDRDSAAVYREHAAELAEVVPSAQTTWLVGHWGLQWYGQLAGMQVYDAGRSRLAQGDALVMATTTDRQILAPQDRARLRRLHRIEVPTTALARLRTTNAEPWGGYYAFLWQNRSTPLRWSAAPLEVFYVFVVAEPAAG
jgi:hypothetical protein